MGINSIPKYQKTTPGALKYWKLTEETQTPPPVLPFPTFFPQSAAHLVTDTNGRTHQPHRFLLGSTARPGIALSSPLPSNLPSAWQAGIPHKLPHRLVTAN